MARDMAGVRPAGTDLTPESAFADSGHLQLDYWNWLVDLAVGVLLSVSPRPQSGRGSA